MEIISAEALTRRYGLRGFTVLYANVESEIDCLREELQEWYDNLPEQFQDGDKGCECKMQ